MAQGRRVLVTGVSRFWGASLARRLESDTSVAQIVAVDSEGPARELARTDFVRADIRHSLVGKLIRGLGIDTVVHAGLIVDPQQASPRTVHETNVIGTMNLLAACSGADSPVRTLVVKSSTAVYGSEADDPSFWTEDMRRRRPARDGFSRDLDEVESYVREFEVRHPEVAVTLLRLGNVLGAVHDTPFGRLFNLPVVPTVLGFDPRIQFLHEDDAVAALEHAMRSGRRGTYNVAGEGVVVLSQALAIIGKINAPVIPFLGGGLAMRIAERIGLVDFPSEFVRLLQFGRAVDTSRMRNELGFVPTLNTLETVAEYGRRRRVRNLVTEASAYRYEGELEEFLRSRARRDDSEGTAPTRRSPRRRAAAATGATGSRAQQEEEATRAARAEVTAAPRAARAKPRTSRRAASATTSRGTTATPRATATGARRTTAKRTGAAAPATAAAPPPRRTATRRNVVTGSDARPRTAKGSDTAPAAS